MGTHPTRSAAGAHQASGLTLIEMTITLTVTAVLLGMAVPSFEQARKRRQLDGVAAQLETDLQLARSLAVAQNDVLRMSFHAADQASCYVIHTGKPGACTCAAEGNADCQPGSRAFRAVRLQGPGQPKLLSNAKSIAFEPTSGTVTPTATMRVRFDDGPAIHLVINVMGRIRACAAAPGLPGHVTC
jgi:type IV fimbrial biogenesis protein FimT